MKIGFDNEKYLKEQSEEIRRRAGKFGKLYLEFGGKLMNDYHAARCLPGYDPNVKLRLLQTLKDHAEVILCLFSGDIERKKMRADFGISYADDALKLIDDLRSLGLTVRGVVITRFAEQPSVMQFRAKLERRGVRVYYHYKTAGYPADVNTIVSDLGYGKNEYVKTEKPIVVVTAPGPGSGKFATCLTQIYHEYRMGKVAGYSKFESFPVWNLPLDHPLNIAYEAATIDLNDKNMIDPYHKEAYGKETVNYNRDVDAFPLLVAIWQKMTNGPCPYRSPTDMGVNRIGFGIVDDEVVRNASKQEIIRRFLRYQCLFAEGATDRESVERAKELMDNLGLKTEDRIVVEAARRAAEEAHIRGKGKAGGSIVSGAAIQLDDGRVVTGRNSDEMHAASAMVINAVKVLSGIPLQLPLIAPNVIQSIARMKQDILKVGYTSLNLDEALIGLAVSATTNPAAGMAMEKLNLLRGCEVHMTHMVTPGDEAGLRRLGCRFTSDPYYATNALFNGGQ
ncbi:MAG: DUF1846 domain-containing protein [Kiritimatiellae bacterium]|nr:DUF1846 domain-containing protein [Kiritimatiellia bacterium]